MQRGPKEGARVKLACLRMLAKLQLDPARRELISGFVDSYLRLTMEEEQQFGAELQELHPQERESVMEIVTSWMERGLEQGRQEGGRRAGRGASCFCVCSASGWAILIRQWKSRSRAYRPTASSNSAKPCSISTCLPTWTPGCNRIGRRWPLGLASRRVDACRNCRLSCSISSPTVWLLASVLATRGRERSESERTEGHSRGTRVHSRKSRSSRARRKNGRIGGGPARPRTPKSRGVPLAPMEHADPLLRSVTAPNRAEQAERHRRPFSQPSFIGQGQSGSKLPHSKTRNTR